MNSPFNVGQEGQQRPQRAAQVNVTWTPVMIRQLMEAKQLHPDAPFNIDNQDMHLLCVVAAVRNIMEQATNIHLLLEDGTGSFDARCFLETEGSQWHQVKDSIKIGDYVKVVGRLKMFSQRRYLNFTHVFPIKDFNEITTHNLHALYVHLYQTRKTDTKIPNINDGMTSNVGMGFGSAVSAATIMGQQVTPIQRQILNFVKQASNTHEGVHRRSIIGAVPNARPDEVARAIEDLIGDGLLYATIDDDHVKSTDV